MGLLFSLIKHLFITPDYIGKQGEKHIVSKLEWIDFCGKQGKILKNIYLPRKNGETTEIDLLYITQKGIFVIESKNYSGYIFGGENNKNWTSTLYVGKDWIGRSKVEKHHFYNPIWQNNTHIKYLKQYLNIDVPIISIIVFSDRCELKEISTFSSNVFVCKRNELHRIVCRIWYQYPDLVSNDTIKSIYDSLFPLTTLDDAIKAKHKLDIQLKSNNLICPWCRGKLVYRTAKRGYNVGQQFLGCSNYPKCKYTKDI